MGFENAVSRAPEESKAKEGEKKEPVKQVAEGPKKLKSAVNKFVGISNSQSKKLEDNFFHRSRNAKLADFEKEMPPALEQAVEQINTVLVDFLKKWGLEEYVLIEASNVVLGDTEKDEELQKLIRTEAGSYHHHANRIRILTEWKMGNYREFVKVLVHEMIHMQAYQSWQYPGRFSFLHQRRQGMRLSHVDEAESLSWLDEAITEELAKRFMSNHEGDIKILGGIRKPAVMAEKANRVVENIKRMNFENDGHSYKKQREELSKLITTLHIHGRKKYKSRDEVFRLFTNAALNGRLLPVARAIEKTKGRGSFKKMAGLDIDMKEKDKTGV